VDLRIFQDSGEQLEDTPSPPNLLVLCILCAPKFETQSVKILTGKSLFINQADR